MIAPVQHWLFSGLVVLTYAVIGVAVWRIIQWVRTR